MRLGSIEAGGTKFVCAIGDENFTILDKKIFETSNPTTTLDKVKSYFEHNQPDALSVGSFGPINLNKNSPDYGKILATPKREWQNVNLVDEIKSWYKQPIFLTTDVNSSAYGEYSSGGAKGCQSCVYVTVGTGIGAGVIQNGFFAGGTGHLEVGHSFAKTHLEDENFEGVCPYHGASCFEGVASGPSIERRTGIRGEELSRANSVWKIEAYYLAQLAYNLSVSFAPEKIIFGGGVIDDELVMSINKEFSEINQGYIEQPSIVKSKFTENDSATIDNFNLAKMMLDKLN
ncbi:ROK family protein [Enterococcus sp. LJL90]